MRSSLDRIACLALIVLAGAGVLAQSSRLNVERHRDFLRVTAPDFHFLTGKALDQLHDGSSVNFGVTLAVVPEKKGQPGFALHERFAVSFDLWEEKYSVIQSRSGGHRASRLTAEMAEAWLLDALPIPIHSVPEQEPFVVRLECYADKPEIENGDRSRAGLTLASLIDVFSRKDSEKPLRWEASTRQLRLSDLKTKQSE
jgi:hypothetical protein